MRGRDDALAVGVLIYDGVEPIDIGGTVGVISMARRVLPALRDVVIAPRKGPVTMAGGLAVLAPFGVDDAPPCDVLIVCGGPGWPALAEDAAVGAFLRRQAPERVASVCTGAMILAAHGLLDGRRATTRRLRFGPEAAAPLSLLAGRSNVQALEAALVEDVVTTGGGVSLAIDTTLHLLGRFYGEAARDEVARGIEYDRAFAANRAALGVAGRPLGG